jgi:glutathione synthase/RimK-type ligase-like ATP-grasp enzyme
LNIPEQTAAPSASLTPYLGLAPYLRMSIAGTDLRVIGQEMINRLGQGSEDANLWLNLSLVMLCVGQRELGLSMQGVALALQRVYRIPAAKPPARLKVLMLMAAGDLTANVPLECLLEDCDIELLQYYVCPGLPLDMPVPEHDLVFVALSESEENRDHLAALEQALKDWPKPVVNSPRNIPLVDRVTASVILHGAPGLVVPPTLRAARAALLESVGDPMRWNASFAGCVFPIIVRPVGSHAGRDLEKLESLADLAAYLERVAGDEFFISPFVDYSGGDGLFRKCRIALIDGAPFACHMAVSSDWMVHYVNAGMYEDSGKRLEEAAFMEHFEAFAQRHGEALQAIRQRLRLDYVCIDCAETRDGRLLLFEVDHAMVVHAMDPVELFPYKQVHMHKVKSACRDYFLRLCPAAAESEAPS